MQNELKKLSEEFKELKSRIGHDLCSKLGKIDSYENGFRGMLLGLAGVISTSPVTALGGYILGSLYYHNDFKEIYASAFMGGLVGGFGGLIGGWVLAKKYAKKKFRKLKEEFPEKARYMDEYNDNICISRAIIFYSCRAWMK